MFYHGGDNITDIKEVTYKHLYLTDTNNTITPTITQY